MTADPEGTRIHGTGSEDHLTHVKEQAGTIALSNDSLYTQRRHHKSAAFAGISAIRCL